MSGSQDNVFRARAEVSTKEKEAKPLLDLPVKTGPEIEKIDKYLKALHAYIEAQKAFLTLCGIDKKVIDPAVPPDRGEPEATAPGEPTPPAESSTPETTPPPAETPPTTPPPTETPPATDTPPTPAALTDAQRRHVERLKEDLRDALEDEEKKRLVIRGLDRTGFFGSIKNLFTRKVQKTVEEGTEWQVKPDQMKLIEQYAVQKVTGHNLTAAGNETYRLMERFGYEIDDKGEFKPKHPQSGASKFLHRLFPTGGTVVGGIVLGQATRAALMPLLGGLLGSIGGGAIVGGVFGGLRGHREGTEAYFSGDAWLNEIGAALQSGNEAQIELAVHKAEKILADEETKKKFFKNRTRMEALRILERHQEGIRRLAMIRMASEAATAEFRGTEAERKQWVAERYATYCRVMNAGEEKFMERYAEYSTALAREVGIVAAGPGAPGVSAEDAESRRIVERGFARDLERKKAEKRRMVTGYILKGALVGGVAGGAGWLIGHYLIPGIQNWLAGRHGGEGAVVGGAHIGPGGTPVPPGAEGVPPGGIESGGQHWGYFTNENTMPEQGFSVEYARAHGFGGVLDAGGPTAHIDGQWYAGTDQGAALREATRVFDSRGVVDFHGMDKTHVFNLMNFAGAHDNAVSVDTGAGYHLSSEQVQAVVDRIAERGDIGALDANALLAQNGVGAVGVALGGGAAGAATGEAGRMIAPGWLLAAGGLLGGAGGVVYDRLRRNKEVAGTGERTEALKKTRGIAGAFGEIKGYGTEPAPTTPATETTPVAETTSPTSPDARPVARPRWEGKNPAEMTKVEAEAAKTALESSIAEKKAKIKLKEFMGGDELEEFRTKTKEMEAKPDPDEVKKRDLANAVYRKRVEKGYEPTADILGEGGMADRWDWEQAENYLSYIRDVNLLVKANNRLKELETAELAKKSPARDGEAADKTFHELGRRIAARRAGEDPDGPRLGEPTPPVGDRDDRFTDAPVRVKGGGEEVIPGSSVSSRAMLGKRDRDDGTVAEVAEAKQLGKAREEARKYIPSGVTEERDIELLKDLFAEAAVKGSIRYVFYGYDEKSGNDLAGALVHMLEEAGYDYNKPKSELGHMAGTKRKIPTVKIIGVKPKTPSPEPTPPEPGLEPEPEPAEGKIKSADIIGKVEGFFPADLTKTQKDGWLRQLVGMINKGESSFAYDLDGPAGKFMTNALDELGYDFEAKYSPADSETAQLKKIRKKTGEPAGAEERTLPEAEDEAVRMILEITEGNDIYPNLADRELAARDLVRGIRAGKLISRSPQRITFWGTKLRASGYEWDENIDLKDTAETRRTIMENIRKKTEPALKMPEIGETVEET